MNGIAGHDKSSGERKEPFFGFLEWMTACALVSGVVVTLLLRIDGFLRVLGLAIYGVLVALSAIWLYRYWDRKSG